MIKIKGKKLFRNNSNSKYCVSCFGGGVKGEEYYEREGEIEWEMRPGGMLVQKRGSEGDKQKEIITVRVSTGSKWHDICIGGTSTFGELKLLVSIVTGLEPREQRLLFKGKEREDEDHLHMIGVNDSDKVLLLEDPAFKDRKLEVLRNQVLGNTTYRTIVV